MKTISEIRIMKDVKTYICMFLMIMGMCANAWGAGALTFTPSSLTFNGTLEDGIATPDAKSITVRTSVAGWSAYLTDVENSNYEDIHYEHVSGDEIVFELNAEAEYTTSTGTIDGVNFLYFERTSDVGTISIDVTAIYAGTENLRLIVQAYDASNNLTTYYIPITVTVTAPSAGHNITYHVPGCASKQPSKESNVAAGTHSLPTGVNVDGYTFMGWTTNSSFADGASAPTPLYTSSFTMPGDRDVELYAVYTKANSGSISTVNFSVLNTVNGDAVTAGDWYGISAQKAGGANGMYPIGESVYRYNGDANSYIYGLGTAATSTASVMHVSSLGCVYKLEGTSSGYTLKNCNTNTYLAMTSEANNKLDLVSSSSAPGAKWTVTKLNSDNNASTYQIKNATYTSYYLKFVTGPTPYWTANTSAQTIYLFRVTTDPTLNASTLYTINPTCESYTVTYNINGGTGTTPTDSKSPYKEGSKVTVLSNTGFEKAGAVFVGWSETSSATIAQYTAGSTFTISKNTTLYAVWKPVISITYKDQGDVDCTAENIDDLPTEHVTGGGNTALVAGTKTNYNFRGWFDNQDCTGAAITEVPSARNTNLTLYAKWEAMYTDYRWKCPSTTAVTVLANDGSEPEGSGVCQVENGTAENCCYEPAARVGYTLLGFYTEREAGKKIYNADGTMVMSVSGYTNASGWIYSGETLTLYAQWTVNDYTAKLDKNTSDGSGTDGSIKVTYDSRNVKAITHASRTGYTLTGYYSAASGGTLIVNADGTLSDKSHSAWLSSTEPHNWIHADNDGVLYARWEVNKYAVTLKANDGVTEDRTSQFTYGAKTVGTFSGFTRTGYTLDGYYTTATGGVMVLDASKKLVANVSGYTDAEGNWIRDNEPTITLWAHWTIVTYNLSYYNVEGATNNNPATYNVTTPTFTLVDPVKTGHTFGGWYTAAGLGTLANTTITQGSTGDKNFYAKWNVNDYSATLKANYTDGVDGSITVTYGTRTRKAYTGVTRDGWRLDGYYTTEGGGTMIVDADGNLCDIKLAQWLDESHNWIRTNNDGVLFAHWTQTDYTITCQTKTGSVLGCSTVEAVTAGTENVVVTLNPECVPAGYHLLEWECSLSSGFTTDVANRQITIATMPTKNVTVTAVLAPDLTVTGTVQLTSGQNIAVYAPAGTITISSTNMSLIESVRIKYYDKNDGDHEYAGDARSYSEFRLQTNDYTVGDGGSGNINVATVYGGENSKTFSMVYKPSAAGELDHYQMKVELLVGQKVYDTKYLDVYGRSLPEKFAIVMKNDGDKNWYALPNDLDVSTAGASSTKAPLLIEVDNQTTPTKVTIAPTNAAYKADGRYEANSHRGAIRFLRHGETSNAWITTSATSQLYMPNNGADKQQFYLNSSNFRDYLITQDDAAGYRISMVGGTIGWYNTGSNTKVYLLPIEAEVTPKEADVIEWSAAGLVAEVDATGVDGLIATIGETSTSKLAMNQTMTSAGSATKYDYTFNFGALTLTDKADKVLYLKWMNGASVVGVTTVKVPRIISGEVTRTAAGTKTAWENYDEVVVLPGAKLTVDDGAKITLKKVSVYPGATLNITGLVQTNTLILRAGWSSNRQWAMPEVTIASTATLTKTNAYLDWYVDYHRYYPIAVPFPVTVTNMSYVNSNSAASAGVTFRTYNGAHRAEGQQTVGQNWQVATPTTLTPSTGYTMTAKRPTGKAWSIVRMPLTFTNDWTTHGEQAAVGGNAKNTVSVGAWGVDTEQPWYCQGWNFIANPYMTGFKGDGIGATLIDQQGLGVTYATIPNSDFSDYDQWPIEDVTLSQMSGFFVQVGTTGTLTFARAAGGASAPALAALEVEEEPSLNVKANIVLSGNGESDQMGLRISETYTAGYDMNADLGKVLGTANTLKTYMVYGNDMAYLAINEEQAKNLIPITVKIPAAGSYVFSLRDNSVVDGLSGLYLTDYLTSETVNLLDRNYEFTAAGGTISDRFALNAIREQSQITTGVGAELQKAGDIAPRKFIYQDKMYIQIGDVIYDATGKLVNNK